MTSAADVTVVIATTMSAARAPLLERAVASALSQPCNVLPLLVVNGPTFHSSSFEYWSARNDVAVHYLPEGDYLRARLFGREQVRTQFFSFLDDDDEYLPHGLEARLEPLLSDATIDVVVGNGLIARAGLEKPAMSLTDTHRTRPSLALAAENWLPSCAGLFRSRTVTSDYFSHRDRHLEWTALALRLCAAGLRIEFIDTMTYRVNDTPGSLSKSGSYTTGLSETLRRLLEITTDPADRRVWDAKYRDALHGLSEHHLAEGDLPRAWLAHLRSLMRHGGMRYFTYSRHLLRKRREQL